MSYSVNEIPFLNVLIPNRDNTLHTTLYKKPTDVPSLLHSHSFHPPPPPNCKAGIIYSQALRYRCIISDDDDLDFHLQQLSTILIKRGYNIILASLTNYFPRCALYREMISYNPIHGPLVIYYPSLFHLIWILHGLDGYYMSIGTSFKKTTTYAT